MRAAIVSRDQDLRPATAQLIAKVSALRPRALRARFVALSPPQRTMFVLITALLVIVLATYHRYGFTIDEFKGFYRAKRVFGVLISGQSTEPSDIDMFHGTAPDVIAMALQKVIPQLSYELSPPDLRAVWRRRNLLRLPAGQQIRRRMDRCFRRALPRRHADVVRLYVHQPQGHSLRDAAACRELLHPARANRASDLPRLLAENRTRDRTSRRDEVRGPLVAALRRRRLSRLAARLSCSTRECAATRLGAPPRLDRDSSARWDACSASCFSGRNSILGRVRKRA